MTSTTEERRTAGIGRPREPAGRRIAVVGATGAVGTTILSVLDERGVDFSELRLIASPRSAGRTVVHRGQAHRVEALEELDFSAIDVAFFSAGGDVSERAARSAADQGALVIDNTNTFRMDDAVPLVVPQVNGHLLDELPTSGMIANPNCVTIPLVRLLAPLHERWGVSRVVVSTYQAASGRGNSGISELLADSRVRLGDDRADHDGSRVGPAFDVTPSIDRLLSSGFTLEEQKMRQESRKILDLPGLRLTATCVRVPVVNCHSEAVHLEFSRDVRREELVALIAAQPGVEVHDLEDRARYPTPRGVGSSDQVHVGRVRVDPESPSCVSLWLVADNLRTGAALNAVQIYEQLVHRGTI